MKKYKKTITVYELNDGFIVEVYRDEDENGIDSEFYLHHKDYGVKMLMFEISNYMASDENIILETVDEHIEIYKEEYFDEHDKEKIDYER